MKGTKGIEGIGVKLLKVKVWKVLGWLAHLVSWFACNTRMIVDASSSFSCQIDVTKPKINSTCK